MHRTRDARELERIRNDARIARRKLVGDNRNRTGERTEHVAARAFEALLADHAIASFAQLDETGSDFRVVDRDGRDVRVQVKTSEHGGDVHRQRFPDIPVLVIPRYSKDDHAARLADAERLDLACRRLYHILRQIRRHERDRTQ